MTTIGVRYKVVDRVTALQMPSYTYHYPHLKQVQLAAVKECIFQQDPPSFYHMENVNSRRIRHILPEEHRRTSTICGPIEFARAHANPVPSPTTRLPSMGVGLNETERAYHKLHTTPEELKKTREEWSQFLTRCPERFDIRLPEMYDGRDIFIKDYALRYLRPDLTQSWRYPVQSGPMLDKNTPKPIPAKTCVGGRGGFQRYSRNVSTEPWR